MHKSFRPGGGKHPVVLRKHETVSVLYQGRLRVIHDMQSCVAENRPDDGTTRWLSGIFVQSNEGKRHDFLGGILYELELLKQPPL